MARKPRIEYAGAVYHIINRGNYRKDLFTVGSSAQAFENTLAQTCKRCAWVIHAYVIMSNHFHLLLQTPEGNLVEGMHWLQSTFANRFNRYVKGQGHVFQGRYKSPIVESGNYFLQVADYIHLNPVRAGIVSINDLLSYRSSSYPKFFKRKYPDHLSRSVFLAEAGLNNSVKGMKDYTNRLYTLDEADPNKREELSKRYQSSLVIGSKEYRKKIFEGFKTMSKARDWGGQELREMNEIEWENKTQALLEHFNKDSLDIKNHRKGARWKIEIAKQIKAETSASNSWISNRLNTGHPARLSAYINQKG